MFYTVEKIPTLHYDLITWYSEIFMISNTFKYENVVVIVQMNEIRAAVRSHMQQIRLNYIRQESSGLLNR